MSDRLPLFVLTGFLGSGKTTLLRQLLAGTAFQDTAVIVNELGEVALDHELIAFSADSTIVLPGGCVCCAIRDDIERALRELLDGRDAGTVPPFSRIIIETTGIADPMPLLVTLARSPRSLERLERAVVVTVVDGVLGLGTLADHREAAVQVSHADVLVISKCDLADPPALEALQGRMGGLNPWAQVRRANLRSDRLDDMFSHTANSIPSATVAETQRGRVVEEAPGAAVSGAHLGIRSHSIVLEQSLDWNGFAVWATLLLHRYGDRILRIKGMLAVEGLPGPTLFHSAQHLVHPPAHLDAWPSEDRRSRLVFVVQDIDPGMLEASLKAFDHAARVAPARWGDSRPVGAGGVIAGRPVRRPSAPGWIKG